MPTAEDVLRVARAEIGYVETPNNITKYWADLDPADQGEPWCGAFVSWCFQHAGAPLPFIDKPYGYVYCPDAVMWARSHNRAPDTPQPGDIALYGTGGYAVHTGIVEQVIPGGVIAIEGNTSSDIAGSQTNGGGVYRRTRSSSWIVAYLRPDLAAPASIQEDDMPVFQAVDPKGNLWRCDETGAVWDFDANGNASAGRKLGTLTGHPEWHAGGGQANGPVVAFGYWPEQDGYWMTTRDAGGAFHTYRFSGDGSLAE